MGKIILGELVEKRTDIEAVATKNGVEIIGVFGSMVGGQDFTFRLDGKAWDIQLLVSPKADASDFNTSGFELDLEKIFKEKGEISIICLTEKSITLSIISFKIFQSLGDNILSMGKANTLDHLEKQMKEQQASAKLIQSEFSVQLFFSPESKQLRINSPQGLGDVPLLRMMSMIDKALQLYIESSSKPVDAAHKSPTDSPIGHVPVREQITTSSFNKK